MRIESLIGWIWIGAGDGNGAQLIGWPFHYLSGSDWYASMIASQFLRTSLDHELSARTNHMPCDAMRCGPDSPQTLCAHNIATASAAAAAAQRSRLELLGALIKWLAHLVIGRRRLQ